MAMQDYAASMGVRMAGYKAFASSDATTAFEGTAVDRQGFNAVTFAVAGSYGSTETTTHTLSLKHSDDGTTYTAVGDGDYIPATAAVSVNAPAQRIGYVGARRYVKVVITPTAAAGASTPVTAIAIMQDPVVTPMD